ncbi:MAG: outer membrane lipoprotein chaperone LolA [Panacagrimonas sp.]
MILLICALPSAHAASAEDELKQFVENVRTLSGRFVQTQTDEHGEVLTSGAGTMAISRPGRFRWAYEQPYAQLMVCDGARIWAYDPDIAQVTVRPAGEALAGTPAELLAQKSRLTENFKIEDRGEERGLRAVRLEPRAEQSDFKSIDLWLRNGVPQRLRFSDPLGGVTEIELRDLKVNPSIDDKEFRFVPPKGVEVVEAAAGR